MVSDIQRKISGFLDYDIKSSWVSYVQPVGQWGQPTVEAYDVDHYEGKHFVNAVGYFCI